MKKGRARDGMLLGIRKEIEIVGQESEKPENRENEILKKTVRIEGKEIKIILTHMRERGEEKTGLA